MVEGSGGLGFRARAMEHYQCHCHALHVRASLDKILSS